jgi:hypothetical protein
VVYQAVEPLGERCGQAPVEPHVKALEILGHVVSDENRVKAKRVPLFGRLAPRGPTEMNGPNLEGV